MQYPSKVLRCSFLYLASAAFLPLIVVLIFCCNGSASATTSSLSITVSGNPVVSIASTSEGRFAASEDITVNVNTNHASGYELTFKADNSTNLVGNNTGATIDSLPTNTSISAETFSSNSSYNDMWGYKPSKYNSVSNTTFRSSPGLDTGQSPADTLDITSAATSASGVNYTISLGAKITTATAQDSYSNSFTFIAVGNPTPYIINYNSNTTDTVTNLPASHTAGDTGANGDTVTISNDSPERSGYTFQGWCTAAVADGGTCSSPNVSYQPGSTFTLDQTAGTATNTLNLYAVWEEDRVEAKCATPVPGITYMQDITSANKSTILNSMTQNTQYALKDNRDNRTYCVAKLVDGNIWMTQNLDLEIGGANTATLTSQNTNLTTSGSGAYATDYSTSGGVITWSPNPAHITPSGSATNNTLTGSPAQITNFATGDPSDPVVGWANDYNLPYMVEGGDHYTYTSGTPNTSTLDTIYSSLADCIAASHTSEQCAHYHVGNYYNWSAAIASSDSSSLTARYTTASNSICPKGWRLPTGPPDSASSTAREFGQLWVAAGYISDVDSYSYANSRVFQVIRQNPLFLIRAGSIYDGKFIDAAESGTWWSSTLNYNPTTYTYAAQLYSTNIHSDYPIGRQEGGTIRCLVE